MTTNTLLQSENFSLRQQLEALLHEARQNEDKMRRFDQLERKLIGASSLLGLVHLLLTEYRHAFGLLPLARHVELIGSLNFGSANPDRYVHGCGTDFLERLAEVVAICIESALAQERLKLIGLADVLTGVQNRRYFEHRCHVEISQARRYKHPLACMFLDIDKFKRYDGPLRRRGIRCASAASRVASRSANRRTDSLQHR